MSMIQYFFESVRDVVKKKSVYKYVKAKEVPFFRKKNYIGLLKRKG